MRKIILIGTFIISFFIASCNKENIADNGNTRGEKITISASINGDPETRLTFSDEDTVLKMDWSVNDYFEVHSYNGGYYTFTRTEGNNFEGTVPVFPYYYATYNRTGSFLTFLDGNLYIKIDNQKGTIEENGMGLLMLAETENINNGFKFNHMLAILKLNLTLPSDVTATKVDKVTIYNMHNRATYSLYDSTYHYASEDKGYIVANNKSAGFTITENKITAYVAVFPEEIAANSVIISAVIGEDTYSYTMTKQKTIVAGTIIPVNVLLTKGPDRIDITPKETILEFGGLTKQMQAIAIYSDGTSKDITSSCVWSTNNEATATSEGLVTITQHGTTTITASYASTTSNTATITPKVWKRLTKDMYVNWTESNVAGALSADECSKYLGSDVYYSSTDGYIFMGPDNKLYCSGLWIKKNPDGRPKSQTTPIPNRPTDYTNYFFLPDCGYLVGGREVRMIGQNGEYWLSTPSTYHAGTSYTFEFSRYTANTSSGSRWDSYIIPLILP